jgi:dTDP-4-dehydrorhamnose reductase
MMGGGPNKDKKFVNKIIKQIGTGAKVLRVVDDKFGTPTYTHDFANNVRILIESGYFGLYNMVNEGLTSRLEVAREILQQLGLENTIEIEVVGSDYFKSEYFAPRPKMERLINEKLNLRKINAMRNWKICLREYVRECYSEIL